MQTKFTVRVDSQALEAAKRYAKQNNITLTRLISEYLNALSHFDARETPILQEMAGSLKTDLPQEDYHTYLEQKYGIHQSTD